MYQNIFFPVNIGTFVFRLTGFKYGPLIGAFKLFYISLCWCRGVNDSLEMRIFRFFCAKNHSRSEMYVTVNSKRTWSSILMKIFELCKARNGFQLHTHINPSTHQQPQYLLHRGFKYWTLYPACRDSLLNFLRRLIDIHQQDLSRRINTE